MSMPALCTGSAAPRSPQGRADWHAACLSAGRYDLLVQQYAFPLTVFLPDQPPVAVSPRAAWGFFQSFHSAMIAAGLPRLTARVTAEDLPRGGRRRLWTDWFGDGPARPAVLVAQTVCYSRTAAGDRRTELLEFTRLDLEVPAAA
jgi:hypothetical protein